MNGARCLFLKNNMANSPVNGGRIGKEFPFSHLAWSTFTNLAKVISSLFLQGHSGNIANTFPGKNGGHAKTPRYRQ